MKYSPIVLAALLVSGTVGAQESCLQHDVVLLYRDARVLELPGLDQLSESDRAALYAAYEVAWFATKDQLWGSMPMMNNEFNVDSIVAQDSVYGAIGIYADSSLAFVPVVELEKVASRLEGAMAALDGAQAFSEFNDLAYRAEVEQALLASGCSTDLTRDYGMPPYVAAVSTYTPPDICEWYPYPGLCD